MNTYFQSVLSFPGRRIRPLSLAGLVLLAGCQSADFSVPAIQASPAQPVVWHDLLSTNTPQSREFLTSILGWQVDSAHPYAIIRDAQGTLVGGMFDTQEMGWALNSSGWLLSLQSPDLDATLEQVLQNGGKVLKRPREYPNRGRSALVQDPAGAVFELVEIESSDDAQPVNEEVWTWHELITTDPSDTASWYAAVFDLSVEDMDGNRKMLKKGDQPLATLSTNPFDQTPNQWIPVVAVDNLDATLSKVLDAGGRITVSPSPNVANGQIALIQDPTGAAMVLQNQETMP